MPEPEWNKDVALSWFLELVKTFGADQPAKLRAFDAAWANRGPGALKPKWEMWCRRMLRKTRDKATSSPPGFLINCFQNGPDRPLGEEAEEVAENPRDVELERAAYLDACRAERSRILPPEERPSLARCLELRQSGGGQAVEEYLRPFREAERNLNPEPKENR